MRNTLTEVVIRQAQNRPNQLAIWSQDEKVTYRELNESAFKFAASLKELGVKRGDCIAFLGKESHYYYILLFACAILGAVIVPINWRLTAREVEYILRDSKATAILYDEENRSAIEQSFKTKSNVKFYISLSEKQDDKYTIKNLLENKNSHLTPEKVDTHDIVSQLYTSGTTGNPKGVRLAHRSFFEINDSLVKHGLKWIDWQCNDVSLIGIPGFHIGGLWWAMQGFNSGVTNVIMKSFNPTQAAEYIIEAKVTTMCVVPAMLQMLLHEIENASDVLKNYNQIRKIVYGGSPISENLLGRAMTQFKCEFAQIYGLTETGNTAVCLPPESHRLGGKKLKAAGKPYPCVSIKIINKEGVELEEGEIGEVCIRSPAQMSSYWQLKEATDKTLIAGWVHTGDAGYMEEGYLYICDRIKDMIIVAGENIYPAEIEKAICSHPSIEDAAVVGVPDERWGERVLAVIVLKEHNQRLSQRNINVFLRQYLSDFKIPQLYEVIEEIPRNPSGKILRRELRNKYWKNQWRNVS